MNLVQTLFRRCLESMSSSERTAFQYARRLERQKLTSVKGVQTSLPLETLTGLHEYAFERRYSIKRRYTLLKAVSVFPIRVMSNGPSLEPYAPGNLALHTLIMLRSTDHE